MDHHAAPGSLLRSFERHLRARNRSEHPVGNCLERARLAEVFLAGRGRQLEEVTQADLEDFPGDNRAPIPVTTARLLGACSIPTSELTFKAKVTSKGARKTRLVPICANV